MSIRVGIICPYSLTMPGGVQGQVLALARALRADGCNVRVLGPCDGPPPDSGVTPLGASIPAVANGSIAPIAPDPAAQLRTLRALRDEDFDVIHLHEPLAPGPTMTAVLLRPAPLVATYHAAGGSRAYDFLRPGVRWLARRIDRNFAVSSDAKTMAQRALGGEFEVLYNGIEVSRFRNAAAAPTSAPTILFVGRHEPRKGLSVLLDAMKLLPTEVRLWIGGEGPETNELRARTIGDHRIDWLGHLTETEKLSRMRGATVFCAPSLRGESFGVVLLEAMAAGTPVVASALAGYSNVARAGRAAELVAPGDPVSLAASLNRVLSDQQVANEFIKAGFDRVDEFSMRRLAATYRLAYEELHAAKGTFPSLP